jgi:hypothetical protein
MEVKKSFLGQEGVSLIMVIGAMAMVGAVSVGVMQAFKSSTKLSKRASQELQFQRFAYRIESLLRDSEICRSTFYGVNPLGNGTDFFGGQQDIPAMVKRKDLETIKNWEGATPDIDGDEYTALQALPIENTYFRADCPEVGSGPNFPQQRPCLLGAGTPSALLIRSIKLLAYENTHSTAGRPKSAYKNDLNQATVEIIARRSIAMGKDLGSMSEKDKAKLAQVSLGSLEFPLRIPITVSLDSNNRITSCVSTQKDYFDVVCKDLFEGILDTTGNLKCKNLTIYPDTASSSPTISLTTEGDLDIQIQASHGSGPPTQLGSQSIDGSLRVGNNAGGPAGNGDVNFGDTFTNKDDVTITNGNLSFGPLGGKEVQIDDGVAKELVISGTPGGTDASQGRLFLGNSPVMHGHTNRLGIGNASPAYTLDVTGDGRVTENTVVDQDLNARAKVEIGNTVKASFEIINGKLVLTGVDFEINSANNRNWSSGDQTNTSASNMDLMGTRWWAKQLFNTRLGSVDALDGVMDKILDTGGVPALTDLRQKVCAKMRRRSVISTWTGSGCVLTYNAKCTGSRQVMYGWNSAGTPLCRNIQPISGNCPSNQALTGITANGTRVCENFDSAILPYLTQILQKY